MAARPKRVAVRAVIAPLLTEPRIASVTTSQLLGGHVVDVLTTEGDWLHVRGADGYEGWVHRGYVQPARSSVRPLRVSLGCVVENGRGERRTLPLRAKLAANDRVVSGNSCESGELVERFARTGVAVATTARSLFAGTSYFWGGVTPWGADCSGLVQAVFDLHGAPLPRDSWQQAETGRAVPGGIDAVKTGDLLFFSVRPDRRITHVGIADVENERSMVHLSLRRGGYAVDVLTNTADPYVAELRRLFVTARRVAL
jgi:hypothetical protein